MYIRELSIEEIKRVYKERILADFPRAEIKPFQIMKRLHKKGLYHCYGLFDDDELKAYAFLAQPNQGTAVMIDYFAVVPGNRGAGYGSKFMPLLKEQLRGLSSIIIEVESRRTAKDSAEFETRERRISFYKKNGYLKSNVTSRLFGVDYEIMTLPIDKELPDSAIFEQLNSLYDTLFSPRIRRLFSSIQIEQPNQIEKLPKF